MPELVVDFISSLDGYAAAEGWPGWWGLEGPEYLAWLDDHPERDHTVLMGANTYRLMSEIAACQRRRPTIFLAMAEMPKVVFSRTLTAPLTWANTQLVSSDTIEAVREMKRSGPSSMRTLGSLALCRSLLTAGLVDRFRVVVFPVITGRHGPGTDLRRLPRRRSRHGRQPHLRRPDPAPRVRPPDPRGSAWQRSCRRRRLSRAVTGSARAR